MIKGLVALSTLLAPKVNSELKAQPASVDSWLDSEVDREVGNSAGKWPGNQSPKQDRTGVCVCCLSTGAHHGLCQPCWQDLPRNRHHCRVCALPLISLQPSLAAHGPLPVCGECLRNEPPFRQLLAPLQYRFPVDAMIQKYKYSGQRAYSKPLLLELSTSLRGQLQSNPDDRPDVLIPCPMHPKRRRSKGFNQASDIAEYLSRELDIPWSPNLLIRRRHTKPQQGMTRAERQTNLKGAFEVQGPLPEKIALIDDVVTTGATARCLCHAMKQAGAVDVQVWALARTPA